jgi:hypothetical protein
MSALARYFTRVHMCICTQSLRTVTMESLRVVRPSVCAIALFAARTTRLVASWDFFWGNERVHGMIEG